jgi:hypothetical protein
VVHKLSEHLWMVHASDNHRQYDDHLPPGEGNINWAALLAHLYDLHFNGTFILEIGGTGVRREILEGAHRGRHHLSRACPSSSRTRLKDRCERSLAHRTLYDSPNLGAGVRETADAVSIL